MPRTEISGKVKQAGKSKSTSKAKKVTGTKKGKSSTYNQYVAIKMKSLKEENPKLEHRERMQAVVDAWKIEPSNPANR